MRCLNRLRIVRQAAGNTAGAREFCERFDAVERALAASYSLPGAAHRPDARADIPALWRQDGFSAWPGTRFVTRSAAGKRRA